MNTLERARECAKILLEEEGAKCHRDFSTDEAWNHYKQDYTRKVEKLANKIAAIQRGDGQTALNYEELAKAEALYIRWRTEEDLQDSLAHALGWATKQLRNFAATTPPAETSGATPTNKVRAETVAHLVFPLAIYAGEEFKHYRAVIKEQVEAELNAVRASKS